MKSKVIFLDIDGCLNDEHAGEIVPLDTHGEQFNQDELSLFQNIKTAVGETPLILVTGRGFQDSVTIGYHCGAHYITAEHGNVVHDYSTKKACDIAEFIAQHRLQKHYWRLPKIAEARVVIQKLREILTTDVLNSINPELELTRKRFNLTFDVPQYVRGDIRRVQESVTGPVLEYLQTHHSELSRLIFNKDSDTQQGNRLVSVNTSPYACDFKIISVDKSLTIHAISQNLDYAGASLMIGDEKNDIDLMHHVTHVGCPANAVPDLKEYITERKGYVSNTIGARGTIEIIHQFKQDSLRYSSKTL